MALLLAIVDNSMITPVKIVNLNGVSSGEDLTGGYFPRCLEL